MRKLATLTLLIALATTACWPISERASDREDNQQPPTTGEVVSGPAFVDEVEFIYLESWPVQVRAIVRGTLPTPCHNVVWDVQQGPEGATVTISSVSAADEICVAVISEPFEVTLDVGDYTSGDYTVIVNGEAYPFTI